MKRIMYGFLIVIGVCVITGCGTSKKKTADLGFVDDKTYGTIKQATYKFIGESEHFYFKTGKVAYTEKTAEIVISNFKTKDTVKDTDSFIINLFFHNKILYGSEKAIDNKGMYKKTDIQSVVIGDNTTLVKKEEALNPFAGTTKENFKKAIKMEAIFCRENKCKKETFKIEYVED